MTITAVLFQYFDFCSALICLTRKCCSSIGSEYAACPSWYSGALRKLTAGRLSFFSEVAKSVMSYWWFAWSVCPIFLAELGARWCGLEVEA